MRRGQDGLSVTVIDRLVAQAEPVTADDFLRLGIPQDQLAIAVSGIGVELVDVQGLARTAAVVTEWLIYRSATDAKRPFLVSLTANAASYGAGLLIAAFL